MWSLAWQNDTTITYNDKFYRLRLAALASIDNFIRKIFERLEFLGLSNNIYVIYTANNEFYIRQHHLPPKKSCVYKEDINVPIFIQGPGNPKADRITSPTTHTDISPTIFKLADIPLLKQFDGTRMPINSADCKIARNEHVDIEFWGFNLGE